MTAAARVDAQHSSEVERREPPNGSFDGAQNVQLCVSVDEFICFVICGWRYLTTVRFFLNAKSTSWAHACRHLPLGRWCIGALCGRLGRGRANLRERHKAQVQF